MYDADDPYDIPEDAELVAGYIDGRRTTWKAEWWNRFKRAKLVTISAVGERWDADIFDVEPECIWPPENVLPLIATARKNGRWPTVYCNRRNHLPYIRTMFRVRGIEEPPYLVAEYDGVAEIPDGTIGKQFKHPPQIGLHYDLSVVVDRWIGVDYLPGQEEKEIMFCTVSLPPTTEDLEDIREEVIGLPDVGGATGIRERYVHLHVGNKETYVRVAHWQLNDGEFVPMIDDETVIPALGRTDGLLAPVNAHSLVVDYNAPLGVSAVIEAV